MARRYIGDTTIYIQYHDDGDYRGSIVVYRCPCGCKDAGAPMVWNFRNLHAPSIGFGPGVAYDSPEAYDQMAKSAASFGSYYTTMNRDGEGRERELKLEGYPTGEIADAISEAVGVALNDDGIYEVRRRR